MRIGIIGAGNVGSALARGCVAAGHEVLLSAAHPQEAQQVAAEVGASSAESNVQAVADADIVILAVPYADLVEVADELREDLAGHVVIELSNPVNADLDGRLPVSSAAEEFADMVEEAMVVKAFNTVLSSLQATPIVEGVRLDGFYCGDDDLAKRRVAELLESMEYEPLDCGPLVMARVLEDMGLLNVRLNALNGWQWQSAWKLVGLRS